MASRRSQPHTLKSPARRNTHREVCEPSRAYRPHTLASVEDPQIDQMLDAMVDLAPPLPVEVRMRLAYLIGRHRPAPPEPGHGGGPGLVARRDS